MTDIVGRLRNEEHGASWRWQLEAADEIERLRSELIEAKRMWLKDGMRTEEARNAALEEAAQVAYRLYATTNGIGIAAAIRALKDKQ